MSLNENPWGVSKSGGAVATTLYIDDKPAGTASRFSISRDWWDDHYRVKLEGFDSVSNPAFIGESYSDLLAENQRLHEDVQYWRQAWGNSTRAHGESTKRVQDLEIEVERLKQSRKEQAEAHKQKQANLQANFEERRQGKTRNTRLKKELEWAKAYSYKADRVNEDLREQLDRAEGQRQNVADQNVKLMAENAKLKKQAYGEVIDAPYAWERESSIVREHEEQISLLARSRRELERQIGDERRVAARQSKRINDLTAERDSLLSDINCFMEDFSEGALAINRAVEDWNEKTDD